MPGALWSWAGWPLPTSQLVGRLKREDGRCQPILGPYEGLGKGCGSVLGHPGTPNATWFSPSIICCCTSGELLWLGAGVWVLSRRRPHPNPACTPLPLCPQQGPPPLPAPALRMGSRCPHSGQQPCSGSRLAEFRVPRWGCLGLAAFRMGGATPAECWGAREPPSSPHLCQSDPPGLTFPIHAAPPPPRALWKLRSPWRH